jgi:hypothetical protein
MLGSQNARRNLRFSATCETNLPFLATPYAEVTCIDPSHALM